MQRRRRTRQLSLITGGVVAVASVAVAAERTWTDSTGKSTITAELVDVQKGKAILRESDGKEITVPLAKLSEADRAFIKEHSPEHAAPGAKAKDSALTEVVENFYSGLRSEDRSAIRQTLTAKAQSLIKGPKSVLDALPTPESGNRAIRVGTAQLDGNVAEVPVQVRAGGRTHDTKLHLRHENGQWQVFALSATYPDGEKSINFEAVTAPGQRTDTLAELVGKPFSLKGTTIDGEPLDVSQFKGKVVLVDFWATWCGPCRAEIPNVLANYKQHHDDGFDVIAVSVDQDMDAVKSFVAGEKPPWTVVLDNIPGNQNSMATKYAIAAIPAFILVGKDGTVAAVNCRGEQLGQRLTQILGSPHPKLGRLEIQRTR